MLACLVEHNGERLRKREAGEDALCCLRHNECEIEIDTNRCVNYDYILQYKLEFPPQKKGLRHPLVLHLIFFNCPTPVMLP
jgi:hypothetical protein